MWREKLTSARGRYLLFLAGLVALLTVLHFTLGWSDTYVMVLGYFALGLESTLPVPQAIT